MQRSRLTKFVVTLTILLAGSGMLGMFRHAGVVPAQNSAAPTNVATEKQTRAILAVVLANEARIVAAQVAFASQGAGASPGRTSLLLVDHSLCLGTAPGDSCDRLLFDDEPSQKGLQSRAARQLLAQLLANNRASHRFTSGELPDAPVVGLNELRALAVTGAPDEVASFWAAFHQAHPRSQGFVVASRPVVAADGSEAIVHVARQCGGRCGAGTTYLLVRDARGWRIGEAAEMSES